MSPLQLEVDLTFAEFLRFQFVVFWMRMKLVVIAIAIWALGLPVYFALEELEFHPTVLVPWGFVVVLLLAVYRGTRKHYAAFWATENPMRLTISETGIDTETRSTRSHHDWSRVISVKVTREFVLLFVGPAAAVIIPKRCVGDAASLSGLIRFSRSQIASE